MTKISKIKKNSGYLKSYKDTKTKVAFAIGMVVPVGFIPFAPGTFAAAFGTILSIAVWQLGFYPYILLICFLLFAGTWAAEEIEKQTRIHDHKSIVIDEVAGMVISLCAWEKPSIKVVIVAFLLFRFFDILKPWPISLIDKKIARGFGCMADDVASAVACIMVLEILRPFF